MAQEGQQLVALDLGEAMQAPRQPPPGVPRRLPAARDGWLEAQELHLQAPGVGPSGLPPSPQQPPL
eukprot:7299613-Pyramimonas_sp.AAC.1